MKGTKGDVTSVEDLGNTLRDDPAHLYARAELVEHFHALEAHGKAANILLEGEGLVPEDERPLLLRKAAAKLAHDGETERAVQMIRDLLPTLDGMEQARLTYFALADIAKCKDDRILESAALEKCLSLNPAASDVRFRLAYLYSQMGHERLAVYHYRLRLTQGRDSTALNNLGVALGALGLEAKEIEMLEDAMIESDLARANLSQAYVDRGFLGKAGGLANEVLRGDPDDTALRALGPWTPCSVLRSDGLPRRRRSSG